MYTRLFIAIAVLASSFSIYAQDLNNVTYNARHGKSSAMNQLGVWYYTGNKVEQDYQRAFYWWSEGAKLGNPKAIANLGVCYQMGRGVDADSIEAMNLYLTAIQAGQNELLKQRQKTASTNPFDAILAGLCSEKGIGTERNLNSAADYYILASDKGSAAGALQAGKAYMQMAQEAQKSKALPYYNRAFEYLDKAAKEGNNEAQFYAAYILLNNLSNYNNNAAAIGYLRKAAEAGISDAQWLYAQKALKGTKGEALNWYKKSAMGGSGEGMWHYANALMQNKDYDQALYWFTRAAQAGYFDLFKQMANTLPYDSPFSSYLRGMIAYKVDGNYVRADEYFKIAEKKGVNDAKVMRAVLLADSSNPDKDEKKGIRNLEKLASGNAHAAKELAIIYIANEKYKKAIPLLRQASDGGSAEAAEMLAGIYYTGLGTNIDEQGAAQLYKKSMAGRALSEEGRQRMLSMYKQGIVIDKATAEALETYVPSEEIESLLKGSF